MSTKLEEAGFEEVTPIPDNVTVSFDESTLKAKGPLGECSKNFSAIPIQIKVEGNSIVVKTSAKRKRDYALLNTTKSHIKNMLKGVTKGFEYRLKIVYAHFPISVKVKGQEVHIENFYGERLPRVAKIVGNCKVSVEGDDIVVRGVSIEDVGQTTANIEQATAVRRKDQRVFLDGVYMYEKRR